MEADFARFYHRDLATTIWTDLWPASRLWSHIKWLPDDSALGRSISDGWNLDRELMAQVRDAVRVTAHGYRLDGKPDTFPRPSQQPAVARLSDPADAAKVARFFRH